MITETVGPTPEQKAQWEEEGYIVLENALRGAQLQRLQAAFDKAAVECKEDWLARVARDVERQGAQAAGDEEGRELHAQPRAR